MSKWTSGEGRPRQVDDTAAKREEYIARELREYDDGEFAELGVVISAVFSNAANDRNVRYRPDEGRDEPEALPLPGDESLADMPVGELGAKVANASSDQLAALMLSKLEDL